MTSYTWKGGSGDYNDPSNWKDENGNSPAGPPGPSDTADFNSGSVTATSGVELAELILTDTSLDISKGDLSISQFGSVTSDGSVTIDDGNLSTTGELNIISGEMSVDGTGAEGTGNVTVSSNSGALDVYGGGSLTVQGSLTLNIGDLASEIGDQSGGPGTLDVLGALIVGGSPIASSFGSDLYIEDHSDVTADSQVIVGDAGKGLILDEGSSTFDASAADVILGNQGGSSGTIDVHDSGSSFKASTVKVGVSGSGSLNVTGTANVSGTVSVGAGSGSGSVTVSGKLTANQLQLGDGKNGSASILVTSGGSISVGGSALPANTMDIAPNAIVSGQGSISGSITGHVQVTDATTAPTYSLNIDNNGTIDAENGTLTLDGNLSGDGQVLIGSDGTLDLGGSVADDVTITFLPDPGKQLIIQNPFNANAEINSQGEANGVIAGFAPGSTIDLPKVPFVNPGIGPANGPPYVNPVGASYLFETGEEQRNYVLQVIEDGQTYDIKINKSQSFTGGFKLSSDGKVTNNGGSDKGTLITHQSGLETGYSSTATNNAGLSPYSGVLRIQNSGVSGTGFVVGRNLVLTAAHVVGEAQTVTVRVQYGTSEKNLTGYVVNSGLDAKGFSLISTYDFAFVYVPGAVFSSSDQFKLDPSFSGGAVNETGYPINFFGNAITNPNPNVFENLTGNSDQFTNIGTAKVTNDGLRGGLSLPTNFTGHGNSGGPLWIYNGKEAQAVGIVTAFSPGLNFSIANLPSRLLSSNFLNNPLAIVPIYRDPPSNAARIISAMALQNGDADTGHTIQFVLNMSENVTVAGNGPTLTLNDGGTATYNAANSTGTELEFDYIVGASDKTANLEIAQVNSSQAVQAPGGAQIDFSVLDNLPIDLSINAPLVANSLATSQTGEVGAGQTVNLTLTMSGAVTVNTSGGAPTLTLNNGATATYDAAASNPSAGTLVFDYTVGSDEIANLHVTAVNLPSGTTVQDGSGYNADFSAALNTSTGLQLGPVFVSSITPSVTGAIATGQTEHLTLAMSAGVTVNTIGGSPTLSLSDGTTATYDAGASNPSAGTLVFDYVVGPHDYATDLQVLGFNAKGATVTDIHGISADFSAASQYDLQLDVNAPIVTNVTASPSSGEADSGAQVKLTLTLSEAVTVNLSDGVPSLSLSDGATATYDAAASNPSAGTLVFDYTVGATDETANLQVAQVNLDGATITDANGNAADFSAAANFETNLQIGPVFVGSITPALTGEIFAGQTDRLTLSMSAKVTVNTTGGSPTLSLSDGATATYDATASNPSSGTLVFDYTVGANDYTNDLQVVGYNANGAMVIDVNGVNADFSAAVQDLALDVNAATVTDVTSSPSSGEAASGQSVTVTLAMSETVTVNTTNGSPTLSLSTGATANYDSNASNPSAGTLVFDYTVGATDETPDLSVTQINLNGATITDTDGNAADLSAASTFDTGLQVGPVFVDSVTPSQSGDIATGQTVQLTVSMSAGLTVDTSHGSPTLSLSDSAAATYDAAASAPSAGTLVFDYMVGSGDYATDLTVLGLNANGATVTDGNGVSPDFSGLAQSDLGLDVNAAIVTNVTTSPSTGEVHGGQQVLLTLTTSEAVTVNTSGGSPTLDLSDGATAIYDAAASNPATGVLVFAYTVGATDATPDLQITQMSLNGATIDDGNGNAADLTAASNFGTNLQIGPAFVNSFSSSITGELTSGQTVQLTMAMSAGLTFNTSGGLPTLSLNNGGTATYDTTYSDPTTGILVFDYTVGANQQTPDLEVTGVNFPSSPQDANGANADTSKADDTSLGLSVVNEELPIVTAIAETPSTGNLNTGATGAFTLTINESVTVTGAPTLTLNDGGTATYDVAKSTSTSLVFDYTVASTNTDVSSLVATALNVPVGGSIVDGNDNNLDTSLAGLTQTGPEITISAPPPSPNPAPPSGTTALMIMSQSSTGNYEIYDIGNNAVLAAYPLQVTQAGSPSQAIDVGGFDGSDTSDVLARNGSTGAFGLYDVVGNNASGPVSLGAVGTDWSVLGFGDFSGNPGETDMLMRQSGTAKLEVYDISNNQITNAASMGAVGPEWNFLGVGDFSSNPNETDMLTRNANNGALEVYNINHNAIVSATGMGAVGPEWQFVGVGDFSGNPGETDLLTHNSNTGALEVYNIKNDQIVSANAMGAVGPEWSLVGIGDFSGNPGETDMITRNSNTGAFEIYDISRDSVVSAFSVGGVGTDWQTVGVAPYQLAAAAVGSSANSLVDSAAPGPDTLSVGQFWGAPPAAEVSALLWAPGSSTPMVAGSFFQHS